MKKILKLISLLLGVVFLTGCGQQPVSQTQSSTSAPVATQPVSPQPSPTTPNKSGNILWKSEAQGDFARDDRDPNSVCKKIQSEQKLYSCSIKISKKSDSKSECVDGMSVAGCFACEFDCPSVQPPMANQPALTTSNNRTGVQCKKDGDCGYLKNQEPCFKGGGVITLTPYCIDDYCECRCGRNNDEKCD